MPILSGDRTKTPKNAAPFVGQGLPRRSRQVVESEQQGNLCPLDLALDRDGLCGAGGLFEGDANSRSFGSGGRASIGPKRELRAEESLAKLARIGSGDSVPRIVPETSKDGSFPPGRGGKSTVSRPSTAGSMDDGSQATDRKASRGTVGSTRAALGADDRPASARAATVHHAGSRDRFKFSQPISPPVQRRPPPTRAASISAIRAARATPTLARPSRPLPSWERALRRRPNWRAKNSSPSSPGH
jgi:hypothetical protein